MQYVDYGLGFPWAAIKTGVTSAAGSIWSAVTGKEENKPPQPPPMLVIQSPPKQEASIPSWAWAALGVGALFLIMNKR